MTSRATAPLGAEATSGAGPLPHRAVSEPRVAVVALDAEACAVLTDLRWDEPALHHPRLFAGLAPGEQVGRRWDDAAAEGVAHARDLRDSFGVALVDPEAPGVRFALGTPDHPCPLDVTVRAHRPDRDGATPTVVVTVAEARPGRAVEDQTFGAVSALLGAHDDGVRRRVVYSRAGYVVECSEAVWRRAQVAPGDHISRALHPLHPADRPLFLADVTDVAEGRVDFAERVVRSRRGDAGWGHSLLQAARTRRPHRDVIDVAVTAVDVTDVVRGRYRDRLEGVAAEHHRAAVVVLDDDGVIDYWNRCATALFGLDERHVLGHSIGETGFLAGTDAAALLAQVLRHPARTHHEIISPMDADPGAGPDAGRHLRVVLDRTLSALLGAERTVLSATEVAAPTATSGSTMRTGDDRGPSARPNRTGPGGTGHPSAPSPRARAPLSHDDQRRAAELAEALADGQLRVWWQPQVEIDTSRVVGAEALLRWERPGAAPVSPNQFIPLAERSGLIHDLGAHALVEACRQGARWPVLTTGTRRTVSVNVSVHQLADPGLPQLVSDALQASGLHPRALCLEITESTLMEDARRSLTSLERLKALGVLIAVDDFGTGYSSLSYLARFPIDVVKIDRSFVAGLATSRRDAAVVDAVMGLAASLELHTLAEGVETEAQRRALLELGCRHAQGFLWSRPIPATELSVLLSQDAL
ncbi:EAL domain-containing protein [Rhabdothermincola salaria]|uniref:EAL domain-containing protein n=1 Tax=Rhabdothermincola salaria TaxID=2903142 RepID=UPI001E4761FB|nr:EAL domain-containing protein [Rhabdothermincola salaria]MCD9622797.1 EAL domain-containing protein [Rhabdothermincola salaria]